MKRRKSLVFKIVTLSLVIISPILVLMSVYETNTFADKAALYLENKLLQEKLRVHEKIIELTRLVDRISSSVIKNLSEGKSVGEYENIKRIDILREGQSDRNEGFKVSRRFALNDTIYDMYIYIDPSVMKEIVKDKEGRTRIIVVDPDGKVVLPEEYAGLDFRKVELDIKKLTSGRIFEILKKYDINLAEIDGSKFYLMKFDSPFFAGYNVYVVIDYAEAVDAIKRNIAEAVLLDLSVIIGVGVLVFFYVRSLTLPIERIIDQLRDRRRSGNLEEIEVDVKSEELQDMVNMINELLNGMRQSLEEAAEREAELRMLHEKVSRSRDRLFKLNSVMNDLMMVNDKKAVLELACTEAARIFDEIETICYEYEGQSEFGRGGRCIESAVPLTITVNTSEAEYRFMIYANQDLTDEQISMLDIFFNIAASASENRELWRQVENSYFYLAQKLSEISEVYDDETGEHIKRVGEYSAVIAKELGMSGDYVEKIRMFSQLHDIGKLKVPREILTKMDKLTPEEFEIMKRHTVYGAQFLGDQPWLKMAKNIALYHHENWDGTGYPFGLKGEEIPLEARIVKIADIYDALRSRRRYKPSFSHQETVRIILEGDGRTMPSHFDPEVLEAFRRVHLIFNEIYETHRD